VGRALVPHGGMVEGVEVVGGIVEAEERKKHVRFRPADSMANPSLAQLRRRQRLSGILGRPPFEGGQTNEASTQQGGKKIKIRGDKETVLL